MLFEDKPYEWWEALLYAFLNSFPYMALVLFSFRRKWRFSKGITFSLLALTTLLATAGTVWRLFSQLPGNPLYDVAFLLLYFGFFLLAVREPVGKAIFTVLVLMNLGNLVIMASKCLEGLFFPEAALILYRWTYPLMMLPVLLITISAIYFLIFRDICPAEETEPQNAQAYRSVWRFLWLIPVVFYLIWTQHFYLSSGQDSLETAMDILNTVFLILIDLGSILIYRVVLRLVAVQAQNLRLQTEKNILSMQNMQYEHLKQRMEEIRQSRHDLRHQVLILKKVRATGDFSALDQLLERYPDPETPEDPLVYCENETANAVISYFGERARERGVAYTVKMNLPEKLFVAKPDLAVLLGNLLENAAEACAPMETGAFIRITGNLAQTSASTQTLSIIVENRYVIEPQMGEDGAFRSTKHKGNGVGIASVRNIAARYNGASAFQFQDGVFTASVLLNHSAADL